MTDQLRVKRDSVEKGHGSGWSFEWIPVTENGPAYENRLDDRRERMMSDGL